MNNLIFFMALEGTIPFGIYLFLRYIIHQHYRNPTSMYGLLKLSIFFYLIPVPLFSNEIKEFLRDLLNNDSFILLKAPKNIAIPLNMEKHFQKFPNGQVIPPQYTSLFLIGGTIWFCITIGLFIKYYMSYKNLRRKILINSNLPAFELGNPCKCVQEEMHLKRNIQIRVMDGAFTPFTLGTFKPIVVFPNSYSPENIRLVLMHEYIHIKKYDSLIQILGNIVIIIHWYLPFSYLLFHELNSMAELDCDYKVSCLLNEQQIKSYGHLIINSNEAVRKNTFNKSPYISNFINLSKNLTKERLIMLKKRNQKRKVVLPMILILLSFSNTVLAAGYQKPSLISCSDNTISDNDTFTAGQFKPVLPNDEVLFKQVDSYFITFTGDVIPPDTSLINYRGCSHSYVTGTQKRHISDSDGGCTVNTYNAKRCQKCGDIVIGTLLSSFFYTVCPH